MSESSRSRFNFPDDDLRDRIQRFLQSRHFASFQDLEVDVENGWVRISGEVTSFYEKQVALTACQRVAGVIHLLDHIDVQQQMIDDRMLDEHDLTAIN